MEQSINGNGLWLRQLSTALTVWAELIEFQPDTANLIARAIENRTDFWSWTRILSLPANGWLTESIPIPRPDITCDKVSADINVGTILEVTSTPCRATGQQMADLLQVFIDVDEDILTNPPLMTIYMTTLLAGIKKMPLEYTSPG